MAQPLPAVARRSVAKLGTRSSGVLLHPTSLPGPYGIGDIGPEALRFSGKLAHSEQSWWQMLPVVPPDAEHSPYSSFSAFAGYPILLSLEVLKDHGYLTHEDIEAPDFPKDHVDYQAVEKFKWPRLEKAFQAFKKDASVCTELEIFRNANKAWLGDYVLFEALHKVHPGKSWTSWEPGLRQRDPKALESARRNLAGIVQFHEFLQFEFSRQWGALRKECSRQGIGLIGDIPIFVAHDSSDVWSRPEYFWLDKDGNPLKVAGVPPDYFSKTGQLWGNPLYRWDVLKKQGYDWWISRFRTAFERFDVVRLDHFIGFYNYWEIPAGSPTAETGRWVPGPGADLFKAAEKALGPLQIIAEDLGALTQGVKDLRDQLGFPGLRVLHFAFGNEFSTDDEEPRKYPHNCVVYTGTHDNDTTVGWFNDNGGPNSTRSPEAIEKERRNVLRYLKSDGKEINWDLIGLALSCPADTAIIPMQDLLGLGSDARMNRPGTSQGNWAWRMREGAFSREVVGRLAQLSKDSGRAPQL